MTKAATLDADKDLPITDAHRHLWNLNAIRYPWLDAANTKKLLGDYASIMRNYMPTIAGTISPRPMSSNQCMWKPNATTTPKSQKPPEPRE